MRRTFGRSGPPVVVTIPAKDYIGGLLLIVLVGGFSVLFGLAFAWLVLVRLVSSLGWH